MTDIFNQHSHLQEHQKRKDTASTISFFDENCTPNQNTAVMFSESREPILRRSIFSIDFEDEATLKADVCCVNKQKSYKVKDFWEELTFHSQQRLQKVLSLSRLSIDKFAQVCKKTRVMFSRPEVCCADSTFDNSLLSCKFFLNCF